LKCEVDDQISLNYAELHAYFGGEAQLVLYKDEFCQQQVASWYLTEQTVVSSRNGVYCSVFSVDQNRYCARTQEEKQLWLRAVSNIKVKLMFDAPDPTRDDLVTFRSAVLERLSEMKGSQPTPLEAPRQKRINPPLLVPVQRRPFPLTPRGDDERHGRVQPPDDDLDSNHSFENKPYHATEMSAAQSGYANAASMRTPMPPMPRAQMTMLRPQSKDDALLLEGRMADLRNGDGLGSKFHGSPSPSRWSAARDPSLESVPAGEDGLCRSAQKVDLWNTTPKKAKGAYGPGGGAEYDETARAPRVTPPAKSPFTNARLPGAGCVVEEGCWVPPQNAPWASGAARKMEMFSNDEAAATTRDRGDHSVRDLMAPPPALRSTMGGLGGPCSGMTAETHGVAQYNQGGMERETSLMQLPQPLGDDCGGVDPAALSQVPTEQWPPAEMTPEAPIGGTPASRGGGTPASREGGTPRGGGADAGSGPAYH